jgi:mannose-1-phosphate guanylyltransferase
VPLKAIILVGGEGLRLRPLTCNLPKPMVPIVNRPFLEHMVEHLKRHYIDEIILAICYLPDRIQQHFGDGSSFGVKLSYAVEQTPLGTGGAVKNAEQFLKDTFLVFNGDIFSDLDLTEMIKFHRAHEAKATIALTPVKDPTSYGVVELNSQNRVKAFIEKPSPERATSNLINAGTYVFEPEVLALIPSGVRSMLERGLFPDLVQRDIPFYGFNSQAYWLDIGKPDDYFKLNHDLLIGKAISCLPGKPMADDIWLEEGCKIHPSGKLTGPIVMGRGCTIEQDVEISGPTVIGGGCAIGQGSILDEAILWQNVKLGKNVTIRNSVVGNNTVIGDSTWVSDSSIISDNVTVGSGNKMEHGIRVWAGKTIADNAISF